MYRKRIIICIISVLFVLGLIFSIIIFTPKELSINVDLPDSYDFTVSNFDNYVVAEADDLSIHISEDRSPYEDTFWYIEYYQNRFYVDENFLNENNIFLNENRYTTINGNKSLILSLTKDYENIPDITYTYAFIQTNRTILYKIYV